ncbi:MAG: hypothetical protein ACRBM6_18715 [Geminicoccales bacterium]
MGKRLHERRTDRASTDDVIEMERQLWEFAKRPDPSAVPEAKLRPGAFLYRVHRAWHSLGRGSGIASHSFRALRDELLKRDPPVRNLQPKLYGTSPLSQADASSLIDVMLETWHVARGTNAGWNATALPRHKEASGQPADARDIDAIRENLLHTLFRGDDSLLLEEPVGVAPEIFYRQRGHTSLALIIPAKSETTAHLSPSNAYGGFSSLLDLFLKDAIERMDAGRPLPVLIWILKLELIRDNAEFHQSFHCLMTYWACITNWYFRLRKIHNIEKEKADAYWDFLIKNCAFVIYGLPDWISGVDSKIREEDKDLIDNQLIELGPSFFIPDRLPILLNSHRQVKRHQEQSFSLSVSLEPDLENTTSADGRLSYWLYPDRPRGDLEATAETTGLPVLEAGFSPGEDYDLAFMSTYDAVVYHLGFRDETHSRRSFTTLRAMGWRILTIEQFQRALLVESDLGKVLP